MRKCLSLFVVLILAGQIATGQPTLTFAYGVDPAQRVDAYLQEGNPNAPVIVMLHGGAWRFGDKSNRGVWQNKVSHWGAQGYAFFSVNTRLLPQEGPLVQAKDLANAMAHIQQNAEEFGINPAQLFLMGHSAGAHIAALVATDQDMQTAHDVQPWLGTVILDTAALDLVTVMENDPVRLYQRAFGDDKNYWERASPLTHLNTPDGAFLIICSTQRVAPCTSAKRFSARADRVGVDVMVIELDLSHRAINTWLGEHEPYTTQIDQWLNDQKQ